jgi:hypothetical protein
VIVQRIVRADVWKTDPTAVMLSIAASVRALEPWSDRCGPGNDFVKHLATRVDQVAPRPRAASADWQGWLSVEDNTATLRPASSYRLPRRYPETVQTSIPPTPQFFAFTIESDKSASGFPGPNCITSVRKGVAAPSHPGRGCGPESRLHAGHDRKLTLLANRALSPTPLVSTLIGTRLFR